MDGDVSRKEKEIHCNCMGVGCDHREEVYSPLQCKLVKSNECPITMPCKCHADTPEGYRKHIRQSILQWTGICSSRKDIIITVPCDSTDAWIMAAFDPRDGIERIENPWENVLSKKKEYHGIRIPGHKKNNRVYQSLVRGLEKQWKQVVDLCESAQIFKNSVQEAWELTEII